MPKRTNPFQELISLIMLATKGTDYKIIDSYLTPDISETGGSREVDILLSKKNNPSNRIFIECRDYKNPQNVTWIDALIGKAKVLECKSIVAISSSGFSKNALTEARSFDIMTLTLEEAVDVDWINILKGLRLVKIHLISTVKIESIVLVDVNEHTHRVIDPKECRIIRVREGVEEWITLHSFIDGNKASIFIDLENKRIENVGTKIIFDVPLVNMRFQFLGDNSLYRAKLLTLVATEYNRTFDLPLKPMMLGKDKLLVGEELYGSDRFRIVFDLSDEASLVVGVERKKFK